jgi:Base plate wedge protein 53
MDYFTQLPRVLYPSFTGDGSPGQIVALTNILTRSAFLQEIMDNASLFYEYQVKDGETPEVIAHKLYGAADRHWIVLLFNNLSNPYYDFPLVQEQLESLIEKKYDMSVASSMSTIHHHYERITSTVMFNDVVQSQETNEYTLSELYPDPVSGAAVARPYLTYVVDSCIAGPTTQESFANNISVVTSIQYCNKSIHTYEVEENEKRRTIRLIDSKYVGSVENEFRRIMRT